MPNRTIRDWTDSEKVNLLSNQAEVFLLRLMMKADDYGSYYANVKLLKSNLYPLRTDTIRETDISRWIAECEKAGLILVYTIADKSYIRIINFGQRMRTMKKRFPDLPNENEEVKEIRRNPPQSAAGCQPEVEGEREKEREVEVRNAFFEIFKRAAPDWLTDDLIIQEIGKFRNKYDVVPAESGPLVNAWVQRVKKPQNGMVW